MSWEIYTPPTAEPIHLDEAKKHLVVDHTGDDVLIAGLITTARHSVENELRRQLVAATVKYRLDAFPREINLPRPPLMEVSSITYVDTAGDTQTLASTEYTVDKYTEISRVIPAWTKAWPATRGIPNSVTVTAICGYAVPFTAATSDTITISGLEPTDADKYRLSVSGGATKALPSPLAINTDYYIISATGATCEFSTTSGGDAVTITDTGTGLFFLGEIPQPIVQALKIIVGHLYEHRELVVTGQTVTKIPSSAQMLLSPYRTFWSD